MAKQKVCLAYSGGLDTSCIFAYLLEQSYDVAEPPRLSASACYIEGIRCEFIEELCWPAVHCNAIYDNVYLLATSLARPVIARKQIGIAQKGGCFAVGHGRTGKGNDQVRFELSFYALQATIKVLAPWRDPVFYKRFARRATLLDYAAQKNIPVSSTKSKTWSMDENLAYRNMWKLTVDPTKAPDRPEDFTLLFEKGLSVKLGYVEKGSKKIVTDAVELFLISNAIARRHGVARFDIVENRFIRLRSRGCYETPGLTCLRAAHVDLEGLTPDPEVRALGGQF
ncbi:MAG: argininosuccinate synthetase [Bathelium mastoideum]|nr:MAG: argininosuccinate synthetase [Bathelium mastoideum]